MEKKNKFDSAAFMFPYDTIKVQEFLEKLYSTKNDYSWSEHEKTVVLGLTMQCEQSIIDGEKQILLNAIESAVLGIYDKKQKPKMKGKKK